MANLSAVSPDFGPSSLPGTACPKPDTEPEQLENDGGSRITPVMPIPDWLRDHDEPESSGPG